MPILSSIMFTNRGLFINYYFNKFIFMSNDHFQKPNDNNSLLLFSTKFNSINATFSSIVIEIKHQHCL